MEKKSKLLLIAVIVVPVLLVIASTLLLLHYSSNSVLDNYFEEAEKTRIEYKEEVREKFKKDIQEVIMKITGIGLLILAIPTLLTVIGERKNKRKMILAAGIVYIVTGVGIPSAVMCFIANAKMKKQE